MKYNIFIEHAFVYKSMHTIRKPDSGVLRSFIKTPTHGHAISSWITRFANIPIVYNHDESSWTHEGDAKIVVDAFVELSKRMLYQCVEVKDASVLAVSSLKRRLSHWRAIKPAICIHTKPDTRVENISYPATFLVWIIALPCDAYAFSEVTCEIYGISERFTSVRWVPKESFGKSDEARREFIVKHGLGGMSKKASDGSHLRYMRLYRRSRISSARLPNAV